MSCNKTKTRLAVLSKFQETINEIEGYETTKLKLIESEINFDAVIIDYKGDGECKKTVNIECDSPLEMISDVLRRL